MKFKVMIPVLILLFVQITTIGQYNFDSIKICHNKEGALKQVEASEYQVAIEHGNLVSFHSKNRLVNYDATRQLLVLKEPGMKPGDSLGLQLSADGIIVSTKDKSVTVNSPAALLPGFSGTASDTTILLRLNRISIPVEFKFNRPYRINVTIGNENLSMLLHQDQGRYAWDFNIETLTDSSKLLFASVYNKPYFLTIQDNINKVGVRLFADKKNGVYNVLEGLRMYEQNKYGVDGDYILHYPKNGVLKKGRSKFNLACIM